MTTTEMISIILSSTTLFFIVFPLIWKIMQIAFKKTKYRQLGESSQIRLIHQLNDAVKTLSSEKTGALITIINKQEIDHLRTDGIKINASISSSLIVSIFNKKSPLHDGALIIDNDKITYAGTYYKITSKSIGTRYGARHRAALGISEKSDSLTVVVSEETGGVSLVKNGEINKIKLVDFQERIISHLKQ